MNPLQESKQELNAAIRYAENAISSAKQTMESMNTYQEQTGREQALEAEVVELKSELDKLRKEKEASSGPCGCQAYRDLEEKVGDLESEVNALEQPERPTMPIIPKAVAIAIFREGMAYGACRVCDELENADDILLEESEYINNFEVSFSRYIDLSDHLDLDYLRESTSAYHESSVIDALGTLCADRGFECRIHGVDDQEEKKNED